MDTLTRRRFLLASGVTGAAALAAGAGTVGWREIAGRAQADPLPADANVLVLVTLYGGNDGLGTVVPYADGAYHDARPELAYDADEVLALDGQLGLNPAMKGFKRLWDAKRLAIVRGVGYPKPDHSHFRSMDIWQSGVARPPGQHRLDRPLAGRDPAGPAAGGLGRRDRAAAGRGHEGGRRGAAADRVRAADRPDRRRREAARRGRPGRPAEPGDGGPGHRHAAVRHRDVRAAVGRGQRVVRRRGRTTRRRRAPRPAGRAGWPGSSRSSPAASRPASHPVYAVSLGGFDTHADEKGTQSRLLGELDTAVSGFLADMDKDPRGSRVVVAIYSEFGRRVAANASQGTDHGTAGPLLVAGHPVRGGFYGDQPSLTSLDAGDLKVTTDFRSVYGTCWSRSSTPKRAGCSTAPGPPWTSSASTAGIAAASSGRRTRSTDASRAARASPRSPAGR